MSWIYSLVWPGHLCCLTNLVISCAATHMTRYVSRADVAAPSNMIGLFLFIYLRYMKPIRVWSPTNGNCETPCVSQYFAIIHGNLCECGNGSGFLLLCDNLWQRLANLDDSVADQVWWSCTKYEIDDHGCSWLWLRWLFVYWYMVGEIDVVVCENFH